MFIHTTYKKEDYMIDFIENMFSEIIDFFLSMGVDKLIDKFSKKK